MAENRSGIVAALIAGVGGLIITALIILVILGTFTNANLLRTTESATTVISEKNFVINGSGIKLANFNSSYRSWTIITVVNATNTTGNYIIASPNYTLTTSGRLINNTAVLWNAANVTYSYVKPTNYEETVTGANNGFIAGLNNISEKLPTILLISAVILLFGVIVLLYRQYQGMGIGNNGGL